MSGLIGQDINEQYLNKLYEDLSREQMRLMGTFKETLVEEGKDKGNDLTKQLTLLNTLMINTIRFRNLKKTVASKGGIL